MTFQQRLVVDNTFWAGPEKYGSILVFFGGESAIDSSLFKVGIISKSARRLQALIVYIEHRFYGSSIPLGSIEVALGNPDIRSCLNSEQALADYAEIILSLKTNLSATECPVIVVGGSYSGMLAGWFRLKYPHIAIGALAASAPVFFTERLPQQDQYCSIVSRDFQQVNKRCHDIITASWSLLDEMNSLPNGFSLLRQKFNLCSNVKSLNELKEYLVRLYSFAAQYNGVDNFWIEVICDAIVGVSIDDFLAGIARAIAVIHNHRSCYDLDSARAQTVLQVVDDNSQKAWNWQRCSELVHYDECTGNNQMLPQRTFNLTQYMSYCQLKYDALPRPHWVSTYFGGQGIIRSLRLFGSNIIFSNGLMDPFSGASVLYDLSDTIIYLKTNEGSHCLDLSKEESDDPKWLKKQREREVQIFIQWIREYENVTGIVDKLNLGLARKTVSGNVFRTVFGSLIFFFLII